MVTAVDYTPFGMIMQGMNYGSAAPGKYRYGFNGKEWENSTKGNADQIDYGERMYDNRAGRFLSVDPLIRDYPYYTPYQFAGNNPIRNLDLDGKEPLDFSWNWLNKMISKGSKNDFVAISNDPALGAIAVEAVYDKWSRQTWFITKQGDKNYYWQHDPGANQSQRIVSNKPGGSNGHWAEFERQETRQARLTNELMDNLSMGVFNMTVGLVTGGISSSGAFGTGLLGKIGAGLTEDLIAQSLTTGFDYKKFNLTSLGGNVAFAKFKYGFVGKNLTSSFGEASIEGGISLTKENFSSGSALLTAGVGMALDATLNSAREGNVLQMNNQQFTRLRNLSYKPKNAKLFQGYNSEVWHYRAADPIGTGVGAGVISNVAGDQLKKAGND
jgi:RHS repeat-associated protein